jgi:hypothetical protein
LVTGWRYLVEKQGYTRGYCAFGLSPSSDIIKSTKEYNVSEINMLQSSGQVDERQL